MSDSMKLVVIAASFLLVVSLRYVTAGKSKGERGLGVIGLLVFGTALFLAALY